MKDDLLGNKIFGAVTGTLLLLFGLRQVSEMVFATRPPAKPGYHVAIQEAAADAGPVADVPPDWGTVLPTADANAGATIAGKCKACHNFDNGGPNMTGPNLWGVIGRKPGSHPGFAYSAAMTGFGAKQPVWDFQHVYEFIAGPQAYLDGTKMSFVGLKERQDRINVIAWLRTQSSSPVAIPPANPAAAGAAKAPAAAAAL
ncbi:MAG: c-type cytochrome, partial [Caulobacteraceae bacterium]